MEEFSFTLINEGHFDWFIISHNILIVNMNKWEILSYVWAHKQGADLRPKLY